MKRKIIQILSKILNIAIVVSVISFLVINFENLTYYISSIHPEPTMSLHAKYQYWLEDIYGKRKGVEIYRKFRDFTIYTIKENMNLKYLAIISIMMVVSIIIDRFVNKKINKGLLIFFILAFLFMYFATFVTGPFYINGIYDE